MQSLFIDKLKDNLKVNSMKFQANIVDKIFKGMRVLYYGILKHLVSTEIAHNQFRASTNVLAMREQITKELKLEMDVYGHKSKF